MRRATKQALLPLLLTAACGGGGGSSATVTASGHGVAEMALRSFAVSSVTCAITGKNFATTGSASIVVNYQHTASPKISYSCQKDGVAVAASCTDAGSTSAHACAGNGTSSIAGLTTGAYQFQVKGIDPATGTQSAAAAVNFSVDLVAPQVTGVTLVSKTATSVTLNIAAADPTQVGGAPVASSGVASIACAQGSGASATLPSNPTWVDCSSGVFTQTGLTPNTDNYIFFRVTDNAGNTNLDPGNPPAVGTLVHTNASDIAESAGLCTIASVPAYLTGNSLTASYRCPNVELVNRCSVSGTEGFALQNCEEDSHVIQFTSGASDGAHAFCVYDSARGPAACVSFTKDTVAPTVSIDNKSVTSTGATFAFSGDDATSGVTHFTCALEDLTNHQIYNAQGQAAGSQGVADLLADSSGNICGTTKTNATHAYASSVTFPALILKAGADYRFHVQAWDAAGNKSDTDAQQTFTMDGGVTGQFLCAFEAPFNDAWKNVQAQHPVFDCTYNKVPTQLSFQCNVTNETTGEIASNPCVIDNSSAPTVCTSLANGQVSCAFRGSFATDSVGATSGDRLNVKVSVSDNSAVLGTLLGQSEISDSFRFDNVAPRLGSTGIQVVTKSSGILATYTYTEPANESGLAANSAGIACRLNDIDIANVTDPAKFTPVPCDYSSVSIVQTASLNFDHNYKLEAQVSDIAGNVRSDASDVFKPTYPYATPTCSLSLEGTAGADITHPSRADSTNVDIHCTNPAPDAGTLAKCLVQARQAPGSSYFTIWQPCTASGLIPQFDAANPATNVALTLDNTSLNPDNLNPLEIKVMILPCDPNFPDQCGQETTLSYFVGKGVDGKWSATETFVPNSQDPALTEYLRKTCNNPAFVSPGVDCEVERSTGWTDGAPTADGLHTEIQPSGVCRNGTYSWDVTSRSCVLNCQLIVPGSTLTNGTSCTCAAPNSENVSVSYTLGGASETRNECRAPCGANETRGSDGTCAAQSSSASSVSSTSSVADSSSSASSSSAASVSSASSVSSAASSSDASTSSVSSSPGVDGGWSNSRRFVLDSLDPALTEYFLRTCNNPAAVAPGADCSIESAWTEGLRTAEGYRTEYQQSGVCRNKKYEWNPARGACVLIPPPFNVCGGNDLYREKVIGDAVDDTRGITNWSEPVIAAGVQRPGVIHNHYHLNLPPRGSTTILNECPANYQSHFESMSGTQFFKCDTNDYGTTCTNLDRNSGRDMDTILFTCTCLPDAPPPPPPPLATSCGTRTWDHHTMSLPAGKVKKKEGCTEWVTDERFVKKVDGYISVGKYNSCTKRWECANAFKYATQWREAQEYNGKVKSCTDDEIKDMEEDPVIMPHCDESGARDGCSKFSNR